MKNRKISPVISDKLIILIIPIIVGGISFMISSCFFRGEGKFEFNKNDGIELCKLLINVWGILLGFLITTLSILIVLNNNFVERLRRIDHYKTILFSYVNACIHILIAITFFCAILFLNKWNEILYCSMIAICIDILIALIFCLFFLMMIIFKDEF